MHGGLDDFVSAEPHAQDTWRETYRGLMSDAVLDDPGFLSWRERFWALALTDPKYSQNTVALASQEGKLIGVAMSGPHSLEDADGPQQLYVLYVYAAFHGSGWVRRSSMQSLTGARLRCCGSPTLTHVRKPSTESTALSPTGRSKPKTTYGRFEWSEQTTQPTPAEGSLTGRW